MAETTPADRQSTLREGYSLFAADGDLSRPGVLLFHGLTGSPDEVRDLAELLHRRGFDVLVPCLSGHHSTLDELLHVPAEHWIQDAQRALLALRARRPSRIAVVGLSFGSILSLYLVTRSREEVSALVMLSCPLLLRSRFKRWGLWLLSYCPDILLDRLGVIKKPRRDPGLFVRPRDTFDAHSIGALARAKYIERLALGRSETLAIPVLALQDQSDHHVAVEAMRKLQLTLRSADFHQRWFPGGEHELTIGPRHIEVNECVADFLQKHLQPEGDANDAA